MARGLAFYKEHVALFQLVLTYRGLELSAIFFCWIPYSLRNFLTRFQNFSQPVGPVRNQFNRFCWVAPFLETHHLVLIGSHSSSLGIECHFICWFPYSLKNFLTEFQIFSQPIVQDNLWAAAPRRPLLSPPPFLILELS